MSTYKQEGVPSSLTLEPNPFEQSFARKERSQSASQSALQQDQGGSSSAPGVMLQLNGAPVHASHTRPEPMYAPMRRPGVPGPDLPSPAPLLVPSPGAALWARGSPSPAQNMDANYMGCRSPGIPELLSVGTTPPVHVQRNVAGENQAAANSLYLMSQDTGTPTANVGPSVPNVPNVQRPPGLARGFPMEAPPAPKAPRKRKKNEPDSQNSSGNEQDKARRQQFLERNRLAAVKCRQRKKVWVDSLKSKSEYYMALNSDLQGEISRLNTYLSQLCKYVLTKDPASIPPEIMAICNSIPPDQGGAMGVPPLGVPVPGIQAAPGIHAAPVDSGVARQQGGYLPQPHSLDEVSNNSPPVDPVGERHPRNSASAPNSRASSSKSLGAPSVGLTV